MTWLYFYIFPFQWPEYEAKGWVIVGNMRPDNWASPNKGNLIVRKIAVTSRTLDIEREKGEE
jgi:hypothetical protein